MEELKSIIVKLTARLDEQDSEIQKVSAEFAAASPSRGGLDGSSPLRTPQMVATNQ